jgi:phytoene/squalene synthetase
MAGMNDRFRKMARKENFPVAGLLTPVRLRPAVRALYAFARVSDDIADEPRIASAERLARLDAMKAALAAEAALAPSGSGTAIAVAQALREELAALGVDAAPAREFLIGLAVETSLTRIPDAQALMKISTMTAAPLGRLMVMLRGIEDGALLDAGGHLATALQVLDHVQDCASDYRRLDRVYLPADWLVWAGVGEDALAGAAASQGLRRVLDLCLDLADGELAAAMPLLGAAVPRRLRLEAGLVHALAEALARRLRRCDPVAGRVGLGWGGRFSALVRWAVRWMGRLAAGAGGQKR